MSNLDHISWEVLREHVFHKSLAKDEKRGFKMDLIKIEPRVTLEKHLHPDVEWVYVVQGSLSDERGTYSSGDFFINGKDSVHTVSVGDEGVQIIACWCGTITPVL